MATLSNLREPPRKVESWLGEAEEEVTSNRSWSCWKAGERQAVLLMPYWHVVGKESDMSHADYLDHAQFDSLIQQAKDNELEPA
jgi:hypothetical protein